MNKMKNKIKMIIKRLKNYIEWGEFDIEKVFTSHDMYNMFDDNDIDITKAN